MKFPSIFGGRVLFNPGGNRQSRPNKSVISFYNLGDQDVIGRSHYEIFPEIPEHWKEIHRRCLAGAVEKAIEDPFPRANGILDWIRWKIHPWYQNDAQVGGILLLSEVITERKQSELALRDSQEKFFQPFTQLDSALSRQYEGAGLSLALVSRLIERKGGRIGVESEPGQGSRFWLPLPVQRVCKKNSHAPNK